VPPEHPNNNPNITTKVRIARVGEGRRVVASQFDAGNGRRFSRFSHPLFPHSPRRPPSPPPPREMGEGKKTRGR